MKNTHNSSFRLITFGASLCLLLFVAFTFKNSQDVEAYYVFSDKWVNGIPTGFMGEKNGKSLKIDDGWKENPYMGEKCIKLSVDNSESWRGLHVQYTGAWNVTLSEETKLADISGYDKLEFYARAEGKDQDLYVLSEIGVGGGGGGEDHVSDTYLEIGTKWKKYQISLKGKDFKRLNTVLYMVLPEGTLYLDEIRFIRKKK